MLLVVSNWSFTLYEVILFYKRLYTGAFLSDMRTGESPVAHLSVSHVRRPVFHPVQYRHGRLSELPPGGTYPNCPWRDSHSSCTSNKLKLKRFTAGQRVFAKDAGSIPLYVCLSTGCTYSKNCLHSRIPQYDQGPDGGHLRVPACERVNDGAALEWFL